MKTQLVALIAVMSLPLGAVALAQPDPPPTDSNDPYAPPPPDPVPAPTAAPVSEPPPTVIIYPPARATVISTEPAYETVQDDWNAPVFASGAVVFLGAYGASVITAASVDEDVRARWAERLYIPVAGPWLALNDYGNACPSSNSNCADATSTKVLLIVDGAFQAAGVATMIAGVLQPSHHRRVVRTSYDTKVRVRPSVVGRGGSGMTVFGRF